MGSRSALLATLALAACTRAEVASPVEPVSAPPPAAAASPASTVELLLTGDVWGEYGPCG